MSTNFNEIFLKMQKSFSELKEKPRQRFSVLETMSNLSNAVPTEVEENEEGKSGTSDVKTSNLTSLNSESSSLFIREEQFQQFLKKTPNIISASDMVYTFVHGDSYRAPIEYISQAKFSKEIHQNLFKNGYHAIFPIQAYSWNEIMLGRAITIVNPKRSGKTMAYLPSLLTLLSDVDNEVENSQGPIGIIFVSSSREVENAYKLCRKMVDLRKLSIVTAFGKWNCADKQLKLLNGVHLLITTPPCFLRLISQVEKLKIIDRERIQFLVFDNFDLIYEKFKADLIEVVKLTTRGADQPEKNPQIIITTSKWLSCNTNMLKLSCRPLVIIGDHIEAGIYSKSRFIVKRLSLEEKQKSLIAYLKTGEYCVEKTIVFVKNELELSELIAICRRHSIEFISLNSYDSIEGQNCDKSEEIWKQSDENMLKVVLATDKAMVNYRLKNAQNIVHYSLPDKWTIFSKRFAASFAFYKNYLKKLSPLIPKAIIMLDENNVMEIPRMISFLRDHRLVKIIPQEVTELVDQITQDLERHKIETQLKKSIEICKNILKFGKCTTMNCLNRHAFIEKFDKPKYLPSTGMIKFRLHSVISPLHFIVKIKEVCEKRNEWISWKEENKEIEEKLNDLQELMGNSENRIIQAPINVEDICTYFHPVDVKWYRAKVFYVGIPDEDHPLKFEVDIHLIDKGENLTVRPTLLMKLDDAYKSFRPLMFDLRILNFIPFDSDDRFDEETVKQIENIFKQQKYNGNYVASKISLSFQNTIFTKNFHVMKFLKSLKIDTVQLHLKDLLLSKEYAIRDDELASRILMLAEKGGLALAQKDEPVEEIIEAPKEEVVKMTPKWEQLEEGQEYNVKLAKFKSPEEFYVRLDDKFMALAKEMTDVHATKPLNNINKKIYCLYVPEKAIKFRALIINDEDDLEIFLLDVGFTLKCQPKELFEMPCELIAKDLRFTTVKCTIAGVIPKYKKNEWDDRYSLAFKRLIQDLEKNGVLKMEIIKKIDQKSYEVLFYDYKERKDIVEIAVEEGIADSKEMQIEDALAHFERLFVNVDALETLPTSQLNQLIGLPETSKLLPPDKPIVKQQQQPSMKPQSFSEKYQNRRTRLLMNLNVELPKLTPLHAHPHIEWYQKELMIGIKIKFIDAVDYALDIDETSVTICIKLTNKSSQFAKIYLYGLVHPHGCSHTKKDNLIRIRLLKRAKHILWPRLTHTKERNNFIKFRDEIGLKEKEEEVKKASGTINWKPCEYYVNNDEHCKDFDDDDMNKPEMF